MNDGDGLYIIIVAAGNGTRCISCGTLVPKQYFLVDDITPIECVLRVFLLSNIHSRIVVVVNPEHRVYFSKIQKKFSNYCNNSIIFLEVSNSSSRSNSVLEGLNFLKRYHDDCKYVMVHDAVRYLVTDDIINRVYTSFISSDKQLFALSVSDNIVSSLLYRRREALFIMNRSEFCVLETPQIFIFSILLKEMSRSDIDNNKVYFDEFSLILDKYPDNVFLIPSNEFNILNNRKITNNADLEDFYMYIRHKY